MILKVERYIEDQKYWLIDGVRKISVSTDMRYQTKEERDKVGLADVIFLDLLKCNCVTTDNTDSACSDCVDHDQYRVKRLVYRLEDDNEYSILFDTIVYVLNDKGKTIEKIVANYKI